MNSRHSMIALALVAFGLFGFGALKKSMNAPVRTAQVGFLADDEDESLLKASKIEMLRRLLPDGIARYFSFFDVTKNKIVTNDQEQATETPTGTEQKGLRENMEIARPDLLANARYLGDMKKQKDQEKLKKKKALAKKAAKKKSKEESTASAADHPDTEENDDSATEEQEPPRNEVAGNYSPSAQRPSANNADAGADDKQNQDWANILLGNPDYRKLSEFIQFYLSKKIPADTFYGVTRMLLLDPRVKTNDMGIQALLATPSEMSYTELHGTRELHAKNTRILTMIKSGLDSYQSLNRLPILSRVLSTSENAPILVYSLKLISQSAEKNLVNRKEALSDEELIKEEQRIANISSQYFEPILILVRKLAERYPDADVKSQAQVTIAGLQELTRKENVAEVDPEIAPQWVHAQRGYSK